MAQVPEQKITAQPFLADIRTIRERARRHMGEGAVTEGYTLDLDTVLKLLNDSLATELVCVLRYRRHHFMARGIHSPHIKGEFLVHANEEQAHADAIAERIVQLGGAPDFAPESLTLRSHSEYVPGETLEDMVREDLVAERIAIDTYREIVRFLGTADPTTRAMMEGILAKEEEHADELADFLSNFAHDAGADRAAVVPAPAQKH